VLKKQNAAKLATGWCIHYLTITNPMNPPAEACTNTIKSTQHLSLQRNQIQKEKDTAWNPSITDIRKWSAGIRYIPRQWRGALVVLGVELDQGGAGGFRICSCAKESEEVTKPGRERGRERRVD
jgi:hypothetical protein